MNAIMDLAARATSFITLIQSTLLKGAIADQSGDKKISILTIEYKEFEQKLRHYISLEKSITTKDNNPFPLDKKPGEHDFDTRAIELVWISDKTPGTPARGVYSAADDYTIGICKALSKWLWNNRENGISALYDTYKEFPTPYNWREAITDILYKHSDQRVELAKKLQYMPMQVLLGIGAETYSAGVQRLLQCWNTNEEDRQELLTTSEIKTLDNFYTHGKNDEAIDLLKHEDKLSAALLAKKVPLSFEQVFTEELDEIVKNRIRRKNEQLVVGGHAPVVTKPGDGHPIRDPFKKGQAMQLYALAFSGGGIRSATFNLGILEGLAKKNMLGRIDYLSTVSGGGYIGSWLAAWIKRDGSVVKVSNRLCPDKSPDPLGEELKPIKWLRMFSNYFAPNSSIMSADSWTVGVTWLRNTLLNQVIIFMILLSVLFGGNALFELWAKFLKHGSHFPFPVDNSFTSSLYGYWAPVLTGSLLLMLPVAIMAGLGMHAYNSDRFRLLRFRKENTNAISMAIISIAVVGAFLISAFLSSGYYITPGKGLPLDVVSFYNRMKLFSPAALVTLACLLIVAFMGKYVQLIMSFKNTRAMALFITFGSAIVATAAGLMTLVLVCELLGNMHVDNTRINIYPSELQYIFGLPLTLEIFSVTIIVRMALLGKYFPDERREWWGRMGAHIHRIAFLWILISAATLLGQKLIGFLFTTFFKTALIATGGWIALIGSTVKAAFFSQDGGATTGDKKSTFSKSLDILGKAGPYIFMLGLLIYLPGLIQPLIDIIKKALLDLGYPQLVPVKEPITIRQSHFYWRFDMFVCAGYAVVLMITAWWLSKKIGVNEFSMHHFYKNRLVRAYLGATRRSTDRQRSSNPFTGFDMKDDEKLCEMTNEYGYYGPYPVLNTALNASQQQDLDRQDRKAESFIFSPLYCGFDFSMARSSADTRTKSYDYAFRPTNQYAYGDSGGPYIGSAMAISGAAVNPNHGYHSSAASAFLLTVFNVQMGRWIGNPRKGAWKQSDPPSGLAYIMSNLVGKTSTRDEFVALSDGGHFDNMGLYEMVRRRCKYIIVCDAEQDERFKCEGFANAIRRCRIDFGAEIDIDISTIIDRPGGKFSEAHYKLGTIRYAGDANPDGKILYIKSSITKPVKDKPSIPVDVQEYASKNDTFPHQTTADQFFDEEQFESYRRLGLFIANVAFNDKEVKAEFRL